VSPETRFHVLHVAEDFLPPDQLSGGVRVAVYNETVELARRGRVTVLAPRILLPPLHRYDGARTFARANASRHAAKCDPPGVRVLRPFYLHVPLLWPITEQLQLLLLGLWAILVHGRDVTHVHGHRIYPMGVASVLIGLATGRRRVVTAHGSGLHTVARHGPRRVRMWMRVAFDHTSRLITVSRDLARIAGDLGVSEKRRRYIPNGVDVTEFRPGDRAALRARLGLPENAPVFVHLGYFLPVKGHAVLVKAFARLVEKRPDAVLVLAGDGPLFPDVQLQAAAAGLGERVRFLGSVDHKLTVPWLQACDALVLPSFNEGTPLVTLEALACGKPVVGTAVGGTCEVVSDERYGILVPPGDDEALARAMDEALRRAWDLPTLRARATEYSWPRIVDQICNVYAEISPAPLAERFRAADGKFSVPS
jgi:glycosyltransferase involved in cell wall biosynthesis